MNLARIRTPEFALFYTRLNSGIDILLGCDYVVEFDFGFDYAELIEYGDLQKKNKKIRIPGFKITRLLSDNDRNRIAGNLELSGKIQKEFSEMLAKAHIHTKIVHVRTSLDRHRIFIRYFSRSPLNLQKFVKPLEQKLQASINLWQVGLRDEARLIGCIGHCGREACCCSWMKQENAVNLKMAKNQGIPLNPASLNGTCNRLKCCFKYENSVYQEAGANLPQIGSRVICADHNDFKGTIINRDILRGKLVLRSRQGKFLTVDAKDVEIKDEG